jgi:cysteine desulfurase
LAVGLGTACQLAERGLEAEGTRLASLRDRLANELKTGRRDLIEHGHPQHRLPNTLSVALPGRDASGLLGDLADDLAASAGSACHGGTMISYVLQAMGVENELARATIRLTLGRFTTEEEIEKAAEMILAAIRR